MKKIIRILSLILIILTFPVTAYAAESVGSSNGGANGHWSAYIDKDTVVTVEQPGGNIYLGQTPTGPQNQLLVIGSDQSILEANIPAMYDEKIVVGICQAAFSDCVSLKEVWIPSTVESIYVGTFFNCPELEKFTVDERNPYFLSKDGVLFERGNYGLALHSYPAGRADTNYEIPNGVVDISNYAFSHAKVTSLIFPSSLIRIYNAFQGAEIDKIEYVGDESQWSLVQKYCSKDIIDRVCVNQRPVSDDTQDDYPTIAYPDLTGPKRLSCLRQYQNGEFAGKFIFEYDDNNRLIETTQYTSDGLVYYKETYTYDTEDRLLSVFFSDSTADSSSSYYNCYLKNSYQYDGSKLIYSEYNHADITRLTADYSYDANGRHIKTEYTSFRDIEGQHSKWEWNADNPQEEESEWAVERFAPNLMCGVNGLRFTDAVGHTIWELRNSSEVQLDSEGKIVRIGTADSYTEFIYENEEVIRILSDDEDLRICEGAAIEIVSFHYIDGEWVDADSSVDVSNPDVLEREYCENITMHESDGTCCTVQRRVFRGKAAGTTSVQFTDVWTGAVRTIEIVVEEMGISEPYPAIDKLEDGLTLENLVLHDIDFEEQNETVLLECNAFNTGEETYWLQAYDSDHNIIEEVKLLPQEKCRAWQRIWKDIFLIPAKRAATQGDADAQKYVLSNTSAKTPISIDVPYNGSLQIVDNTGAVVFEITIPDKQTIWYENISEGTSYPVIFSNKYM